MRKKKAGDQRESSAGQSPGGSQSSGTAMVTLVAQTPKQVMGQQSVAEGDQVDVKLQLLKAVPLEGKLVTLDAGLLRREVAQPQQWKVTGGIPFGPAGFA